MARLALFHARALAFLLALTCLSALAGVGNAGPHSFCQELANFGEAKTPAALQAALKRTKLDYRSAPVFGPFDSPDKMIDIIASSPAMAEVRTLSFQWVRFSADSITRLGRSPHLSQIRNLSFYDELPTESVLAALSDISVFPSLARLEILKLGADPHPRETGRQIDALAPAFASLVASGRLQVLGFTLDQTSAALLDGISAAKRQFPLLVQIGNTADIPAKTLKNIASLDPGGIHFKVEARSCAELARLDRTGFLRRVTDLSVECGDTGARLLARSRNLASLTHLRIFACGTDETKMTVASARALATLSQFPNVRHLALLNDYEQCQEPGIGAKGLEILLGSSLAGQLETLVLREQGLGEKGVRALVLTDKLSALRRLQIAGEHLPAKEARSLVRGAPLSETLEELSLAGIDEDGGVTLDEPAALAIAGSLDMPKLRFLDLSLNQFSGNAVSRLRRAPWIVRLEVFKLGDGDLEAEKPASWSCEDELLPSP